MQLVEDRNISSQIKTLALFYPPVASPFTGPSNDMTNEDYRSLGRQTFAWRPNGVVFHFRYEATWLNAYKAEDIEVSADSVRAILIPLTVTKEGSLNVFANCEISTIHLPPGHYKVLVELRDVLEEELLSTEKYRDAFDYLVEEIERQKRDPPSGGDLSIEVELCTITFVPTQKKIAPQIMKFDPHISYRDRRRIEAGKTTEESFTPNSLIMFDEPWKSN